jgi:hypothetical protein
MVVASFFREQNLQTFLCCQHVLVTPGCPFTAFLILSFDKTIQLALLPTVDSGFFLPENTADKIELGDGK